MELRESTEHREYTKQENCLFHEYAWVQYHPCDGGSLPQPFLQYPAVGEGILAANTFHGRM